MSPELGLGGKCGQHVSRELGTFWDTWNCRWAMVSVGGGLRCPYAQRSKFKDLWYKIFSVTAITVPEKALKLMRDRKEWGSDPRLKRFKSTQFLFSECLAFPTQGGSEDRFSSRNIIKLY